MICLNNNLNLLNAVVEEAITEITPAVQERDFALDDFIKCYEKYILPKTEQPIKNYKDIFKKPNSILLEKRLKKNWN